jgi:hypothetical protein
MAPRRHPRSVSFQRGNHSLQTNRIQLRHQDVQNHEGDLGNKGVS